MPPTTPTTPTLGSTGVSIFDNFWNTQSNNDLLASSDPSNAPATPLLKEVSEAVFEEPATKVQALKAREDGDQAALKVQEKVLLQEPRYKNRVANGNAIRAHLVKDLSEEIRTQLGKFYKNWSIDGKGERGKVDLNCPEHVEEVKCIFKYLYETFNHIGSELYDDVFAWTDHEVKVHPLALQKVFVVAGIQRSFWVALKHVI